MLKPHIDRRKTLEELEGSNWGDPDGGTSLVQKCHQLRRVPLQELTPSDLRFLITQQIGLLWLVPLALEILNADPLIDAGYYTGDLLCAVVDVPEAYWTRQVDMAEGLHRIVDQVRELLRSMDESSARIVRETLTAPEEGSRSRK